MNWEPTGKLFPVEVTMDSVGRVLVPKAYREALGLEPGSKMDISVYGAGLQITPGGRTARLVEKDGHLVATGDTVLTDDVLYALIDAGRR